MMPYKAQNWSAFLEVTTLEWLLGGLGNEIFAISGEIFWWEKNNYFPLCSLLFLSLSYPRSLSPGAALRYSFLSPWGSHFFLLVVRFSQKWRVITAISLPYSLKESSGAGLCSWVDGHVGLTGRSLVPGTHILCWSEQWYRMGHWIYQPHRQESNSVTWLRSHS